MDYNCTGHGVVDDIHIADADECMNKNNFARVGDAVVFVREKNALFS